MNVLHVIAKYPPSLGGMEKVAEELADAEAKAGHRTQVLTSSRGATHNPAHRDRVPVKRLRSIELLTTPLMPGLLPALLRTPRQTVVHLHIAQAFTPEMVWLAAKIRGFSYVAHVHLDVAPGSRFGFLLKMYKPLLLKRVLHGAQSVMVFNEAQRTALAKQYDLPLARIAVIPNGVEPRFVRPTARRAAHKPLRLLFVGRLCLQKNVAFLLRALEGVSAEFETRIVGDGELRDELQTLAQTLHLQNVTFAGRKDGEALLKEYERADIFVLPSEREGMSLVALEALAMALPIVASDVTGNRDVVQNGHNGRLVPLNDVPALRSALLRLKDEPKRYAQLSTAALQSAAAYQWDNVAAACIALYENISKGDSK